MKIVRIKGATHDLGAPKGWNTQKDGPCESPPVRVECPADGTVRFLSAWKPDAIEIERLQAGAALILSVVGGQPPVWIHVDEAPLTAPSTTGAAASDRASTDCDAFPARKGDWMQTFSGRRFWPLDPRAEDVAIEDIAHALSLICRYGGHCLRFYSVAEHSVHLARWVLAHAAGTLAERRALALWLLLHDGSEGYITDLIRPLKRNMPEYRRAEDGVAWTVYEAFGLDPAMEPAEVKALDNRILMDERAQNMRPTAEVWNYGGATEPLGVTLQFWTPEQAEREFLSEFAYLTPTPEA